MQSGLVVNSNLIALTVPVAPGPGGHPGTCLLGCRRALGPESGDSSLDPPVWFLEALELGDLPHPGVKLVHRCKSAQFSLRVLGPSFNIQALWGY